jgi:penicillin-binding protein 2
MRRDADRQKVFQRRAVLLAGGKALLLSALASRMYYLQVIEAPRYATLADENRINLRLLPPPRGRILDRHGRPLAVNEQTYRVTIVAEQAGSIEATLDTLGTLVEISALDRERILREVRRKRSFVPVTILENLDWDAVARIEVNAPALPGVAIDEGQTRHYPYGEDFAHVLGYVAAVSEKDLTGEPLLELPGFKIGKAGIEKTHDRALRGTGGRSEVEVNAFGRVIRELSRKEGEPGADLTITLDLDLQRLACERLQGESGAIVVMDIHGGEVLALASNPSYDPSGFARGLKAKEWRDLITNPRAPLTNKAIAGQYAPGSTFKIAVALAGLEKGVITAATPVFCGGSVRLGDSRFHCWKRGGHGRVSLRTGIVQSCDVYFYEVARRLGVDAIAEMAERLGLGAPLGLDLPGERGGLIPTRDWKRAKMGEPWHKGETLITGIGQGYVLSTPLQLAVMTARVANGGYSVSPRLLREARDPREERNPGDSRLAPIGIQQPHLQAVLDAMAGVVNAGNGTARSSAIREAGFEMGGKTGTSQVRRITRAERAKGVWKNEDLPWERRDHALFVGYAPVHAPRYAVAVIIEHGGGGSKAAAPVARDVLLAAQKLDSLRIAPPAMAARDDETA